MKRWILFVLFAVQARKLHKRYNVSAEYMEIVLRIEYLRKVEHWSDDRYVRELEALARRFPTDVINHFEYQGKEK